MTEVSDSASASAAAAAALAAVVAAALAAVVRAAASAVEVSAAAGVGGTAGQVAALVLAAAAAGMGVAPATSQATNSRHAPSNPRNLFLQEMTIGAADWSSRVQSALQRSFDGVVSHRQTDQLTRSKAR